MLRTTLSYLVAQNRQHTHIYIYIYIYTLQHHESKPFHKAYTERERIAKSVIQREPRWTRTKSEIVDEWVSFSTRLSHVSFTKIILHPSSAFFFLSIILSMNLLVYIFEMGFLYFIILYEYMVCTWFHTHLALVLGHYWSFIIYFVDMHCFAFLLLSFTPIHLENIISIL